MYLEFKEERDADFIQAYKTVITTLGKQARFTPRHQLIELAVNHSAKRYYVSYEQASRIIARLIHRKKVIFKNPIKKEMYYDILREMREKRKQTRQPFGEILAQIIYGPAPRFYLSPKSASILFYTLLKNKQL